MMTENRIKEQPKAEDNHKSDVDKAQAVIAEHERKQLQHFQERYNQLCAETNCIIEPIVTAVSGTTITMGLRAKKQEQPK